MSEASPVLGAHELALVDALREGGVWIRPRGVSMRPTLIEGDTVELAAAPARLGAIALVSHRGKLWLHRLVWHRRGRWLLWGDARVRPEGWVEERQILAIAVARRRDDGGVLDLARGPGRFLGVCSAAARRPLRRFRRQLTDLAAATRRRAANRAVPRAKGPPAGAPRTRPSRRQPSR